MGLFEDAYTTLKWIDTYHQQALHDYDQQQLQLAEKSNFRTPLEQAANNPYFTYK